MAQESSAAPAKAPWTKIFTAFKVALDLKKLVLAAAGILLVWIGWALLSMVFFAAREFPTWEKYEKADKPDERLVQWDYFKYKRGAWNLIHELAGTYDEKRPVRVDAGDIANSPEEYKLLKNWEEAYQRINDPILVAAAENEFVLQTPNSAELKSHTLTLTPADDAVKADLVKLKDKRLTIAHVRIPRDADKAARVIVIDGVKVKIDGPIFEKLRNYRDSAKTLEQIAAEADATKTRASFDKFKTNLIDPKPKVAGLMRVSPWFENRGGNPYLIAANAVKTRGDSIVSDGNFFTTFVRDEIPVLMEPLYKFLLPIVYLFDQRASAWDRLYLILALLWTLVIWGFFGGAICRIAAVQVARNERIPLRDAVNFTRERFISYIAAPLFPLFLVGILTLCLMIFGWIEWVPYIGDFIAGLFWPIVILLGFIMTIVLVGLVGWPLMVATISTEGTDSFDAMSRSYSYVYQAPWHYLWYSFVSVVYGAAVVFFIGFMASMMVFMGKWGVSSATGLANNNAKFDREPSYLFYYAPTSFGWRDLMISSSLHKENKSAIAYDGRVVERIDFKDEYEKEMRGYETMGAGMMTIWIYPLFLLVVGFGYSFFWSASTIVYFLMRHHVDDTEMDEVHMEDEDIDDPFLKAPPSMSAPAPAAPLPAEKPGTVSLNLVEPPPPSSTAYTTSEPPPSAPATPPPENPPPSP